MKTSYYYLLIVLLFAIGCQSNQKGNPKDSKSIIHSPQQVNYDIKWYKGVINYCDNNYQKMSYDELIRYVDSLGMLLPNNIKNEKNDTILLAPQLIEMMLLRVINLDSLKPEPYVYLKNFYNQTGQFEKSYELLFSGKIAYPDAELFLSQGLVSWKLGNTKAALQLFKKSMSIVDNEDITLNENSFYFISMKAELLFLLNDKKTALDYIRKKLNSDSKTDNLLILEEEFENITSKDGLINNKLNYHTN